MSKVQIWNLKLIKFTFYFLGLFSLCLGLYLPRLVDFTLCKYQAERIEIEKEEKELDRRFRETPINEHHRPIQIAFDEVSDI